MSQESIRVVKLFQSNCPYSSQHLRTPEVTASLVPFLQLSLVLQTSAHQIGSLPALRSKPGMNSFWRSVKITRKSSLYYIGFCRALIAVIRKDFFFQINSMEPDK
ncbi:hypothetical protein POPTR_007G061801v4 [Populus trichocarpa]|uniref:Uncharacterized protein n=1 Tax=Populus trichocarpa TaxID=3694 RepID=A0ACC0SPT8_POPTR|nr:hypothetical protein POPTR_007G061801v4 [Populus trichocarpa]